MDENLFVKLADDIKDSNGLVEEDEDFLKSLEKMANEVKDEPDSID
jgi:hypothetical protein